MMHIGRAPESALIEHTMSNTTAHGVPLVNTRTTFQRTRDARFFTGRIQKLDDSVLSVVCLQEQVFASGDKFAFHVFGSGKEAFFFATFKREATTTDPLLRAYVFVVETEILLRPSNQDARFMTHGLYADLDVAGFRACDGLKVVDISANGLCLTCPMHMRKGDCAELTVHVGDGFVKAHAEVRYCIKDKSATGGHRIGFRLQTMDRISMSRWRNLYSQIVHASRYCAIRGQIAS